MHHLYYPELTLDQSSFVVNDSAEAHHCVRVLRLKKGDKISFFNGAGIDGEGEVESVSSSSIAIKVLEIKDHRGEQGVRIVLACAMPKNVKFDDIVDKCSQCGVDEVIPLYTDRTEVVLKGDRANKRVERFRAIALSAAKQAKRATIPQIHPIMSMKVLRDHIPADAQVFMPHLDGDNRVPIRQALADVKEAQTVFFLIGPEGDFTPEEVAAFSDIAKPLDLGRNVLRVDTAAVAVVSCAHFLLR